MLKGTIRFVVLCASSASTSSLIYGQPWLDYIEAPPGPGSYGPGLLGLSSDGTVAVGHYWRGGQLRPLKWTREEGGIDVAGATSGAFEATCSAGAGIVILGFGSFGGQLGAWRWTPEGGFAAFPEPLGAEFAMPYGVSEDGLAVAGVNFDNGVGSFRWIEGFGFESIPAAGVNTQALAMSADGSTVVGGFGAGGPQVFLWRSSTGTVEIPLTRDVHFASMLGVSFDGRYVAGASGAAAALYDTHTALLTILNLPNGSPATGYGVAVTADGQTVVGNLENGDAFIWDAKHGAREIGLDSARAMSADGAVIAGTTWVLTRREPEPYTGRPPCQGDVNGDDRVTHVDLAQVLTELGRFDPDVTADCNGDSAVDALDLSIVLQDFGDTCPYGRPPIQPWSSR